LKELDFLQINNNTSLEVAALIHDLDDDAGTTLKSFSLSGARNSVYLIDLLYDFVF